MYALRERRQHVTQEDFEFAVAKVRGFQYAVQQSLMRTWLSIALIGLEEEPGGQHECQQAILVMWK